MKSYYYSPRFDDDMLHNARSSVNAAWALGRYKMCKKPRYAAALPPVNSSAERTHPVLSHRWQGVNCRRPAKITGSLSPCPQPL